MIEMIDFARVVETEEVRGQGGFGEVRVAVVKPWGRVAVKFIRQDMQQVFSREQFLHEAKVMDLVKHENVLKVYATASCQNRLAIVTRLMDTNLLCALRNDKLPSGELRMSAAFQAAQGLLALHENNILHRDIKSPNLLVTEHQISRTIHVCWTDFGLARDFQDEETIETFTETSVAGTRGYVAPELYTDKQYSKSSDVFAFGVVLAELVSGRLPFDETKSMPYLVHRMRQGGYRDDECIDNRVQPFQEARQIIDIIRLCTQQARQSRLDMKTIVDEFKADQNAVPSNVEAVPPQAHAPHQSRECKVCLDRAIQVLLPCGHACLCGECVLALLRRNPSVCPVCRQPFKEYDTHGVDQSAVANTFYIPPSTHVDFPWRSQGEWLELLKHCSVTVDNVSETILAAMRQHRSVATIQEKVCWLLWDLSANADNQITLMQLGVGQEIITAMQQHNQVVKIKEYACGALWNLAANVDNQITLMQVGAGQEIITAMEQHRQVAKIQEHACAALWNLAVNADNRTALRQLGAEEEIITAIKEHQGVAYIHETACGALLALATDVHDKIRLILKLAANVNNRIPLMEIHAGQQIITAMQQHRGVAEIQAKACAALWKLAIVQGNKIKLMELGAGEEIITAMQQHSRVAQVQEKACGSLHSLAVNASNVIPLVQFGVGQKTITAMQQHREDAKIQARACALLWNLAVIADKTLMQLGAGEEIITAMHQHRGDPKLQEKACAALSSLAVKADNQIRLMEIGTGQAIITAMQQHRRVAKIQEKACYVFWKLAGNTDIQITLMQLGAGLEIITAMQQHRQVAKIQENACAALWKLAANADNQSTLMRHGAGQEIITAMRQHRGVAHVQDTARGALRKLAMNSDNQTRLMQLDADQEILLAMQQH